MTDSQISNDNNPERDAHLFGSGPKRMLALDGGGVRGAITVAFLERIEKLLDEHTKEKKAASSIAGTGPGKDQSSEPKSRLSDWFDLVGGTSTGAIIAGALALGHSTAEIKDFYLRLAPRVFTRPFWRLPGLQAKFDARALRDEIDKIVKDRTLDSPDLKTGLCVVTKRLDTGSPWILANNPRALYWDSKSADPAAKTAGHWGNRHYRLANLVRASTAAPHFFDPEVIAIIEDERKQPLANVNARLAGYPLLSLLISKLRVIQVLLSRGDSDARNGGAQFIKYTAKGLQDTHGLFVDGGVTPYNNPCMALLMMTQLKGFGLEWPLGSDKLSIFSIGTGSYRTKLSFTELGWFGPLKVTLKSLLSVMNDTETLALAQMQWLGECPQPWEINTEIGDMAQDICFGKKWFRFLRYDVRLECPWLKKHLNLDLSEREVERFRRMDDPGIIKCIYGIARIAAEQQVKLEHLSGKPASLSASEVALSA
jgi:Patatin-like phospholipase